MLGRDQSAPSPGEHFGDAAQEVRCAYFVDLHLAAAHSAWSAQWFRGLLRIASCALLLLHPPKTPRLRAAVLRMRCRAGALLLALAVVAALAAADSAAAVGPLAPRLGFWHTASQQQEGSPVQASCGGGLTSNQPAGMRAWGVAADRPLLSAPNHIRPRPGPAHPPPPYTPNCSLPGPHCLSA